MIGDKEREERLLVRREIVTNQGPVSWSRDPVLTNERRVICDNEGSDSGCYLDNAVAVSDLICKYCLGWAGPG